MGAEQAAIWRIEDFLRIPVMLNYPSGRIHTQNQRSDRCVR